MRHALLQRFGHGLLVLWAAFTLSFVLLQVLPGDAVLIKFQNPDLGLSRRKSRRCACLRRGQPAVAAIRPHAAGDAARGFRLFATGRRPGQRADCQQSAGYPEPRPARVCACGPAGVCAGLCIASAGSALAEQYSPVSAGPVYLPTHVLAGDCLIQLFSFQLRLIPVINPTPLQGLILPIVTVAIPISAPLAQILMRSLDQVATQPFVAVARAKG